LGQLRYRPYGSQETFAHSLGDARGVVTVPAGVELFFAIDPRPGRDISSLANVPPHLVKGVQMIRALVNDEGLASLRNFDAMEILILDGTRIGDEGVKHLSGLASLRMLGLEGTKITDAGLAHLEGLKNLESLSVGYTNVTPEALAKLREHLPKLKEIRGETMLGPPKPIDSKTILP
jgi:hypothetical protein